MFPPLVTDKPHHLLHSVGNFPIPQQEENKGKTSAGGNDSRVLLTVEGGDRSTDRDPALCLLKGGVGADK